MKRDRRDNRRNDVWYYWSIYRIPAYNNTLTSSPICLKMKNRLHSDLVPESNLFLAGLVLKSKQTMIEEEI